MKKPAGKAVAGWYEAPETSGFVQFWNGKNWTKNKLPIGSELPEVLPPPRKKSFIEVISISIKETFKAKGRVSRRDYFVFFISQYGLAIVTALLFENTILVIIPALLIWGLMPTHISLIIKRCHDSNHSGFFYLIPVIGPFVVFFEGDYFENRFGVPV